METFREILNEEMGVAAEVVETSNRVYRLICKSIQNKEFSEDNVGTVKANFRDCTLSISYEYLNFASTEEYKYASAGNLGYGWSAFIDRALSFIRVQICAISGTIQKDLALDTIQHEIEHVYQQSLMQKEFGGSSIYASIKTDMQSKDSNIAKAGRLMYGCVKSEQEGYANGLYSFLMAQHTPRAEDSLKNSPAWVLYEEMKSILSDVKKDQELETYLKTKYNITTKEIEYKINKFLRRIARVVIKANYDKISKQNWRQ